VVVDMGRVRFDSAEIPVSGPWREVLRESLVVGGRALEFSAATVSNRHCVVLRQEVPPDEARELGPLIERDPQFPRRSNVQFVQVLDRRSIRIEIWERGPGIPWRPGAVVARPWPGASSSAIRRSPFTCRAGHLRSRSTRSSGRG
jgi:diaminopimelate epimerase